jgi:rRNA processing protein Gar1
MQGLFRFFLRKVRAMPPLVGWVKSNLGWVKRIFGRVKWVFGRVKRVFGRVKWVFGRVKWVFGRVKWVFGRVKSILPIEYRVAKAEYGHAAGGQRRRECEGGVLKGIQTDAKRRQELTGRQMRKSWTEKGNSSSWVLWPQTVVWASRPKEHYFRASKHCCSLLRSSSEMGANGVTTSVGLAW